MSEIRVLRVLAIDDDSISLSILRRSLQQCGYEVTATTKAMEAVAMLREKKDEFDIVLTDIMMPEMDGFKLLEIVRFEIDIPVIMISSDSDVRTVVKGVKSGAQDFFVKPVQLDDLKRLWEHVVNKKPESDSPEDVLKIPSPEKGEREDGTEVNENDSSPQRKYRKLNKRIVWTAELHRKFVDAVHQLQVDDSSKIIPTRILEIMNEPILSRENVASHLQKYRRGLTKQREVTGEESSSSAGAAISTSISNPGRFTTNCSNSNGQQYDPNGSTNSLSRFFAQSGTPYPYHANQNAMLLPSNTPNNLPYQQKLLQSTPQIVDQMHPPPVSGPLLGNIISGPLLMPEKQSIQYQKVHDPRTRMFDDYNKDDSWKIPFIMPRQQIPSNVSSLVANYPSQYDISITGLAPQAQSHNAFNSNYQMHRGVSNQMYLHPQFDSLLPQAQSSLSGYHDVQNSIGSTKGNFNFEEQNQMDEFVGNELIKVPELMQENPDRETIDRQFSDDLNALMANISVPRL